jgi:hypothetical protein
MFSKWESSVVISYEMSLTHVIQTPLRRYVGTRMTKGSRPAISEQKEALVIPGPLEEDDQLTYPYIE